MIHPLRIKNIHFVGVGGIGMSALALVLHEWGFAVTGSDLQESEVTAMLTRAGIRVQHSHDVALVKEADAVVYSSAVAPDNAELRFAAGRKLRVMKRAVLLGEVMRSCRTVCVAGTHGKTTTTAMISAIFVQAGQAPTIVAGGMLKHLNSNAIVGNGKVMIAEADEYDRSFLSMAPTYALVTNIEREHLDCYANLQEVQHAFREFVCKVPFYGVVVCNADDAATRNLAARVTQPTVLYGEHHSSDYRISEVTISTCGSQWHVQAENGQAGRLEIGMPGRHNISNATAAAALALEYGIPLSTIREALGGYRGVRRRFDILGKKEDVTVIDDYAHHPTEVAATIAAAREAGYGRIVAVFQPHLYTRTRDFAAEFGAALSTADSVFVTEIYRAREEPLANVSGRDILDEMQTGGPAGRFVDAGENLIEMVRERVRPGDAVLFMGAGTITAAAHDFFRELSNA
ncbi:MAG: UDP-N-acetylmuramate--L-alanine ligase [Chitinivibrionales bacterium]|nr:UDP-N-acetylmuramate--L-alanine ligase [Chitinivibrionales bacterium]